MIRYETTSSGEVIPGEPFTEFNEAEVLVNIFNDLGWKWELLRTGRGGYYPFHLEFPDATRAMVHIYLKKITFGGRDNRPHEKRVQFSAGLDRFGFESARQETDYEFGLILGIYKRESYTDTVICAWDINEWGYNAGRAFNCFTDIRSIARAMENDFALHTTAKGQVSCCFRPEKLPYYLKYRKTLHRNANELPEEFPSITEGFEHEENYTEDIPQYQDLLIPVVTVLKENNGVMNIDMMEERVADLVKLTTAARSVIHNPDEGERTELGYRLAWARNYLKRAGLLENPKRKIWALTGKGWEAEIPDPKEIVKLAAESEVEEDLRDNLLREVEAVEGIEVEQYEDSSEYAIDDPFDPNLVDIRTRTMSLDLILKRLKHGAIDMKTGFQRKANLWSIEKQSRLIESILVKFPLPAFYFDGSDDDKWLVVDGLQRLSSLDNYVNNELYGLRNLEFLTQFHGTKFSKLPANLQRRIEEFEITAYIISASTPKVLKYNVFKRINTGGLVLTSQEIRNALNQGKPARFIKELASLSSFKLATDYSIPEDRLQDQEFVTRFLAFYLHSFDDFPNDLDGFLNFTMESIYDLNDSQLYQIRENFDTAMTAAYEIFGDDAFRKRFNPDDKRKPINKALFEVWAVILSSLDSTDLQKLVDGRDQLKQEFIALLNNDEFFNISITAATGGRARVKKRFVTIELLVNSIL